MNFCSKCGRKVSPNDRFCTGCGNSINTSTDQGVSPTNININVNNNFDQNLARSAGPTNYSYNSNSINANRSSYQQEVTLKNGVVKLFISLLISLFVLSIVARPIHYHGNYALGSFPSACGVIICLISISIFSKICKKDRHQKPTLLTRFVGLIFKLFYLALLIAYTYLFIENIFDFDFALLQNLI